MIDRIKAACARAWAWCTYKWRQFTAWGLGVLAMFGLAAVLAAPVDVSWDHPTERVDGTPLALEEIAETRWYCDGAFVEAVPAPSIVDQLDLSFGSHDCYATTMDTFGSESDPSATITRVVKPARPNPPVVQQ